MYNFDGATIVFRRACRILSRFAPFGLTRGTVANMSTGYDIHTVKIDTFMNVLWDVDYSSSGNHDDEGNALAIDPSNGNVYVGGFKDVSGQGTDFVTLMYNDAGSLQWSAMWNDTADGGDTVKALVVDASGNVTVTGSAWNGSSLDYHTVQYDDTGTLLWERSFNDKYNFTDAPKDIALTSDNGVVVTGQSLNPDSTWSYVTVKYLAHEFILPVDSDSVSTSLRWLTNRDQLLDTDTNLVERVKYYSNQCYPNLYFMDDTLSYVFFQGVDTSNADTLHRIDMTFNGANAAQKLLPMDKESYWNNYYLGHIPEGRPFVSLHDRLVKQDVWPNIDVVYSSNQRGLKYYIVVHPGGETGAISLEYHGFDALSVDGNDALVIESSIGELVQPQALAYEMDANGELDLLAWQPEYDVTGGEVIFKNFDSWDGDLVIEVNWGYVDALAGGNWVWTTFFGGSFLESGYKIRIDPNDEIYLAGMTSGTGFPVTQGNSNSNPGMDDFFAIKFGNNRNLLWSTRFGNDQMEHLGDLEPTPSGNLILVGATASQNMFTRKLMTSSYEDNSLNTVTSGVSPLDGFILELASTTGIVEWATYYGGNGNEETLTDLVVTSLDDIFVCGTSPATGGTTQSNFNTFDPGGGEYFSNTGNGILLRFNAQREVTWGTKYGTSNASMSNSGFDNLILNSTGEIFVVEHTDGNDFATIDPGGVYFDNTYNGGLGDLFLMRWGTNLNPNYASYFGSSDNDLFPYLALGPNNELYLGCSSGDGTSSVGDMPLTNIPGGTQIGTNQGLWDYYLARFTSTFQFDWASYFGGSNFDQLQSINVNSNGDLFVGGITLSTDISTIALSGVHNQANFGGQGNNGVMLHYDINMICDWITYFGKNGALNSSINGLCSKGNRLLITCDSDVLDCVDPGGGAFYDNQHAGYGDVLVAELTFPIVVYQPETAFLSNRKIQIWPNPSDNKFNINSSEPGGFRLPGGVKVYDLNGRPVYSAPIASLPSSLSLGSLPSGIYTLQIEDSFGKVQWCKLILQ